MKYLLYVLSLLILPIAVFAEEYGFVPLTNVPFLTDTGNSFDLSQFLNNLYRLAIGVAAVIAVLQIMRAGIMYMGGDSVTEKKEAKNLIGLSIAGLVLVLSPVVVFSVINPEILSLRINNIEELAPTPGEVAGQGDGTCSVACDASEGQICRSGQCVAVDDNTCPANIGDGVSVPSERGQRCCAQQEGCTVVAREIGSETVMTCSCESPEDDAAEYGYRVRVEPEQGGGATTHQAGGFDTSAACSADLNAYLERNNVVISGQPYNGPLCNCGSPLSEQHSSCSNL